MHVSFQVVENILLDDSRPAVLNSFLTKGLELILGFLVLAHAFHPVPEVLFYLSPEYLVSKLFDVVKFLREIMKEVDSFVDCITLWTVSRLLSAFITSPT